jgi:TonB family protein
MGEAGKHWEGQVVDGRFCLRRYLGGCQHSAVFLTEFGAPESQNAAIKLVPADPENAELQLSRWELAAKLSHPHLIRLLQMGCCQLSNRGLLYVVMEYAEQDLSQVLPMRPLTSREAREMLEPALDALAYIHGKRLVHGHLKPANIMAVDDQLKLSTDGLCRTGELAGHLGKPTVYDPPEIVSQGISPAGDVWSLGVTLVEALTQRSPVSQGTQHEDPSLPETMTAPFLDIARHCLRGEPQRRWTVADIAARVREISPASRGQTSGKDEAAFAKLRRYIVPAAALGLALTATAVVGRRLLNRQPEAAPVSTIPVEQPSAQLEPERKPAAPEAAQSGNRISKEEQRSRGASSPSARLRSEAEAKNAGGTGVPGEVLHQVLPAVPPKVRTTIRGKVRVGVTVRVGPSGSVVGASLSSAGPSKYFARLALEAAQRWEFRAAKVDGRDVSSEWILRFELSRTATEVLPVRAAP